MKIGDIKNRPGAPQQTCDSSQNFAARNIPNIFLITPFLYHPFPYKCTHFAHIPALILLSVNQLNINRSHSAKKPQRSLMYTSKIEIEFKPRADHTYCMTILHRLDGVIISGTYGANLWISAFDLRLFLGEGVNFSDFSLYSAV